jgi:hypothetical protein
MLGAEPKGKEKDFNDQEKEVVELLQLMCNKNLSLRHLDLSETGLSSEMILELAKALK